VRLENGKIVFFSTLKNDGVVVVKVVGLDFAIFANFRQKFGVFLKTNAAINVWHKIGTFLVKIANFFGDFEIKTSFNSVTIKSRGLLNAIKVLISFCPIFVQAFFPADCQSRDTYKWLV
jgi:hypothetical protein